MERTILLKVSKILAEYRSEN